MNQAIKAQCKVCGIFVPVDQFKLHYKYKKMVCPNCFSGKTEKAEEKKRVETPAKPPGWDQEDEYLQKMVRLRNKEEKEKAQFTKIPGTEQVRCKCNNCKFSFKYDPFRKSPRTCPYCNEDIPRLKTFNLL
ncbi:MAG: hypothetical protein ABH824_05010 [Nanoarchaeota archaeon]|nr:hypothetical protein [Nanoarchaeota archaeon]MBU1632475.1 hypothetical protein [Nanoarchaeota archaeon]MBU1875985.1 hypothetical protein [Nanoarchaeota archaeon]